MLGSFERLPWADGCVYVGRDGPLLVPTTKRVEPAADLVAAALGAPLIVVLEDAILTGPLPRADGRAVSSELPPALRPWAESLAFLTVEAALHIGPLVRRLDALVRRHDATHAAQGEPDGYGGLTNRGHPERLLLSEWLLAEELPLEFLRRAASRELLHINPTFRTPQPEGRVAVFCDVGPGPARRRPAGPARGADRPAPARADARVGALVGVSGRSPPSSGTAASCPSSTRRGGRPQRLHADRATSSTIATACSTTRPSCGSWPARRWPPPCPRTRCC